jgi:hypothetical protein
MHDDPIIARISAHEVTTFERDGATGRSGSIFGRAK